MDRLVEFGLIDTPSGADADNSLGTTQEIARLLETTNEDVASAFS